jgi:hypothetical protein
MQRRMLPHRVGTRKIILEEHGTLSFRVAKHIYKTVRRHISENRNVHCNYLENVEILARMVPLRSVKKCTDY